jgi:hypothetical protein
MGPLGTRVACEADSGTCHLRHVLAKVGINSRVELARLARDKDQSDDNDRSD